MLLYVGFRFRHGGDVHIAKESVLNVLTGNTFFLTIVEEAITKKTFKFVKKPSNMVD